MKTVMLWYLIGIGYGGQPTYSPPLQSQLDCTQLQKDVKTDYIRSTTKCVLIPTMVTK